LPLLLGQDKPDRVFVYTTFSYGADGVLGGEGDARDIDNFMIRNEEI